MKIKNLVFDIDDTVYHKDDVNLTNRIYNQISELSNNGFDIYFATRRSGFNLKEVEQYITNGIVSDIVCANGLYCINDKKSNSISRSVLDQLIENNRLLAIGSKGFFTNDLTEFDSFGNFLGIQNLLECSQVENISSINIRSEKSEYIESFACESIGVKYDERYKTYELFVANTNKFTKINEVLNGEKFIGFGDNPEDDNCLFVHEGMLLKNEFRHNDPNAVTAEEMLNFLKEL